MNQVMLSKLWVCLCMGKLINISSNLSSPGKKYYYVHICVAPSISIDIYANETPAEQESYALTCNISGHEQLANPTISYMWTKNDTMLMPDSTNSSTLIFPSLRLSDAANYKCIATVASSYLNSAITANETYTLQLNGKYRSKHDHTLAYYVYTNCASIIKVPSPVTVGIINASETIIAGSSDLKCIVQFDEAVDVWLNVKIMWHGPGGVTLITTNQEQMINFTVYTSTTTIEAAISGNYSCEAMISSSSQFIIGNKNASGNLEIIVGMKLYIVCKAV